MTLLSRRTFLRALGLGSAAAVVAPELLVPEPESVRRYWAVPRNAPVGGRVIGTIEGSTLWLNADHGYTYDAGPIVLPHARHELHINGVRSEMRFYEDRVEISPPEPLSLLPVYVTKVEPGRGPHGSGGSITLSATPPRETKWNGNPVPRTLEGRLELIDKLWRPMGPTAFATLGDDHG